MSNMHILSCGPAVTVQDGGRSGYLALGLSRGGAADRLALAEGAALLGLPVGNALEMAGMGGEFRFDHAARIALSGAPMGADLEGTPLAWNASHAIPAGAVLRIGGAMQGVYGYLSVAGGFALPEVMGAQSAHLVAGLGRAMQAEDILPLGKDPGGQVGRHLPLDERFEGGLLRLLPSLQTRLFEPAEQARFARMLFARDQRANRMGVRLIPDGKGFGITSGQTIISEVITPGDVQIPGDGAPYILLSECQTTGGYPRIGTVLPCDLPRAAQARPGAGVRFTFVERIDALALEADYRQHIKGLPRATSPLTRDPQDIPDLLSYNLISGVSAGEETP